MILTPGELRIHEFNKRITYKPGYILTISMNPGADFYNAVMTFQAPNTNDVNEPMVTHHKEVLGRKVDVDTWTDVQICEALVEFIVISERHEIREWLKVDGVKLLDPHI